MIHPEEKKEKKKRSFLRVKKAQRPRGKFLDPGKTRRPWGDCFALVRERVVVATGRPVYLPSSYVLVFEHWLGDFLPITTDGCLGIGPESTRLGDQIVVVDGARSPFVFEAFG